MLLYHSSPYYESLLRVFTTCTGLEEEEDKVSWFSEVVKFRHRFISAGEDCKIRDRESLQGHHCHTGSRARG